MKALLPAALLLALPLAAWSAPDSTQTAAICQARTTCKIAETYDGGQSAAGAPLRVVEVRLGLSDKPDTADEEGCRNFREAFDGGVEYWLLDGTSPPRQLLKLCNDGYGASGVGDDEVRIGPNRLVHWQTGGSAWRWTADTTYTLSPWHAVAERTCSYHTSIDKSGTTTVLDFVSRLVRSLAKDSTKEANDMGCPEWSGGVFSPAPAAGVYGAYNVIAPELGDARRLPAGTAIDDCVPAMSADGVNGFVVYGKPAPPGQAAEIKAIAGSLNSLLVQVFDPTAAGQQAPAAGSWVDLPHLEVWVGHNDDNLQTRLSLGDLSQIGVDLGGRVHHGVGRKVALPSVERWEAIDGLGRPVVVLRLAWAEEFALLNGVALVYSQAVAGKQTRLVATTGIINNRPLYVPSVVRLSGDRCHLRDGLLSKAG